MAEMRALNLSLQQQISRRQRIEAFLQRYERIVSATRDGICLIDTQGIYQIANDTYLSWHEKEPSEVLGQSVINVLGEEVYAQKIQPYFERCLAGEICQFELWVNYPGLGEQFISVGYAPYKEADGTISGIIVALRNLTNLKRAEQALKESELRFRGIFDQMYQFIGLLTPDGILLEANRAALEFGHLTHDEVIGKPFWEIVWWTHSLTIQTQLKAAIARAAQGEFVRYEVEVQGQPGQLITLDFSLRPVFDDAGQVVLLIPEGRDISARIKAEKQLQLQAIVTRNIAEGICMLRADNGMLVYANPKFETMFGYNSGELVGQHVSVLNYQDDSEAIAQELMAAIAAQGEYTYQLQNVRKDGTTFWCEATSTVFDHPDYGSVFVAVHQDITDRLQAEKQLQLQAVITRNMAEGICLVRADNGIVVYANPKFERMFGYEPGELDGQHISTVNYATEKFSAEEVNQAIRAEVLANREATYEVHNVKKDGTPFWCQATTSVFEHPDYGSVLVAVQQDISDRKEAQEKIKASLKEKELLLKEIYHRVKNNLQVIYSLLNLQSRNLPDPAAKAVIRDSQSRVRAMALVHEKLYQSHDLTRINLADYAKSLVNSLQETYCVKNSSIVTQIEIEPCWLDIETALPCGLILTELISNSFKYAFPNHKGMVKITSSSLSDQITLLIQDNGLGLPPGFNLQTISSLGLSLVRNLATQIQANVMILPTEIGTTFQLSLPYKEHLNG
jgi:PAS domain S-box-containing protein